MTGGDAAVVALGEAIKFESDGREFYLQAAQQATNPIARAVFLALAEDEKDHARRVREIYEELKDKPGWPPVTAMIARHSGVQDAFERASANLTGTVPADATAREALATAEGMEEKGLAFYRARAQKASCGAEAEFYRRLVGEEEIHLSTLQRLRRQLG